jgi:hypothetical protein
LEVAAAGHLVVKEHLAVKEQVAEAVVLGEVEQAEVGHLVV